MPITKKSLDPTHITYWITEAHQLKQAADLCWEADENIKESAENAKLIGLDNSLVKSAYEAETELSWLYPNLVAFAIQHLAIGILIKRQPKEFIQSAPHFDIVKITLDCGVHLKPDIKAILSDVENAFKWSEAHPKWSVQLSAEQIRTLKRKTAHFGEITDTQKKELDELFNELDRMAEKEQQTK